MFIYGGLLKLVGDLTALVGPISITQIVEYIQINLNASLSAPPPTPSSQSFSLSNDDYVSHKSAINFYNNYNSTALNDRKQYQTNDYADLSSPDTEFTTINEYTGIYYPNWVDFIGNGWIMAMLVLYATLTQGSLSQASTHIVNMIGIRLRTSLQSLVYRKTLLISTSCFFDNTAKQDSNTSNNGLNEIKTTTATTETKATTTPMANTSSSEKQPQPQPIFDTGTITNLMSEDALNIMSFFWIAHYVWAIPLKVCLSLSHFTQQFFLFLLSILLPLSSFSL